MITEFLVSSGEKVKRLDQFLVHREPDISRSRLQRLIELGRIRVNEAIAKPSQKIKPGDRITMDSPQPGELQREGGRLELEIVYEDEALVVLNKPSGVVVHPTSGNWSGTILNALLAHFQASPEREIKPGIVHRLDKNTSGVMVVAKHVEAHRSLAAQFETHRITRIYEALVLGIPQPAQGSVELPIGRDTHNPQIVSSSSSEAKAAVTQYRVLEAFGRRAAHVELRPQSGRTHQLRVHMASLGCPVLGDRVYEAEQGERICGVPVFRLMLHARTLGFFHPVSGVYHEYSKVCPTEMKDVLEELRGKPNTPTQ